jgi:hypothetical protein
MVAARDCIVRFVGDEVETMLVEPSAWSFLPGRGKNLKIVWRELVAEPNGKSECGTEPVVEFEQPAGLILALMDVDVMDQLNYG